MLVNKRNLLLGLVAVSEDRDSISSVLDFRSFFNSRILFDLKSTSCFSLVYVSLLMNLVFRDPRSCSSFLF